MTVPLVPPALNPVPVHSVALVEFHVSAEVFPPVIEVGLTVKVAVGRGALPLIVTVFETLCPFVSRQVMVYEPTMLDVPAPAAFCIMEKLLPGFPSEGMYERGQLLTLLEFQSMVYE